MSMNTYRAVWMLLMVLVVAPAFMMASGMEGLDFHESVIFTRGTFHYFGFPDFIASILAYPVTVVATVIPGSSSLITMLGDFFVWQGLGVVFLVVFFINFEPPFYRSTPKGDAVTE